ncbi:MAG: hypothetical protein AM325_012835, partial [Candidatus Thorarchaeota archaeon SMTZ1-45]
MHWRKFGVGKKLILSEMLILLALSISLVSPASASIYQGKSADFEYYHCNGYWHTYVTFSVEEWHSSTGIAIIRVINETTTRDYWLKIPEWSIVDSEGNIIDRWPYCPIWLDLSQLEDGMVFDDPDYWLYNFTIDIFGST